MTQDLLNKVSVQNIIFEKVAFQSIYDFEFIISLLNKKGIKAWVNCPRRVYPFFQEIVSKTNKSKKIKMVIKGGNWGLASNAIHMLDLFAFLTGNDDISIDINGLFKKIYKSKRKGFIELGGKLVAKNTKGDILDIIDNKEKDVPLKMIIYTDDETIEIFQKEKLCRINYVEKSKFLETPFIMPLQSELTSILVKKILDFGNCALTTIDESFVLHTQMINAFNRHLSSINKLESNICPIS